MNQPIRIYIVVLLIVLYSGHSLAKTCKKNATLAPAGIICFKIGTLAPAGTTWMKLMKQGAQNINEKTDRRVELKFYPGGVMGTEQTMHSKINMGQLHGGAFTSGGLARIYSDIQVLNLPMIFNSIDEVDYVRSKMDVYLKQNMEQRGFVLLGITNGGFAKIMSQQALTDLEAIRSSKVWIPEGDNVVLETYKSLGISPISLSIADVFTGLQTGLIETVAQTSTAAIAFQWHSSTAYVTDIPVIFLTGLLAIQKKSFDKINAEDRIIVKQVIDNVFKQLDTLNRSDNDKATEALKNYGIEFVKPDPAEIRRWKKLSDQAIANMVESGVVTQEAVDQVLLHLSEYRKAQ